MVLDFRIFTPIKVPDLAYMDGSKSGNLGKLNAQNDLIQGRIGEVRQVRGALWHISKGP